MAKRKPTCNKCGRVHFNFLPCPSEKVPRQPPVRWRPDGSMEGWTPFGDTSDRHEFLGGNLVLKGDADR